MTRAEVLFKEGYVTDRSLSPYVKSRRSIFQRYQAGVRRRRGIGMIAGLLGIGELGTSIANAITLERMGRQVNQVIEAMNTLQGKMQTQGESIKELYKLNDDTFAVLHESTTAITEMVNDARCEASAYANAIQGQLVAHIFEESVRKCLDDILSASFSGTLSPIVVEKWGFWNTFYDISDVICDVMSDVIYGVTCDVIWNVN